MQTHSYIATVQVDFEYDHTETSYNDARMAALHMAVRPLFHVLQNTTKVVRVVVSDNEGAGVEFEMEEE